MHKLIAVKKPDQPMSMQKAVVLACFQLLVLVGCDANDPLLDLQADPPPVLQDEPQMGAAVDGADSAEKFDDNGNERVISLYLESQSGSTNTPDYDNRVIVAEPVFTVPALSARAQGLVDGVNVVIVGSSCQELQATHSDLYDCIEEEIAEIRYGKIQSTVRTDVEGFASISLGNAEKYRLRVQSFVTNEDPKCFWSGEAIVDFDSAEVVIPLLVFCE